MSAPVPDPSRYRDLLAQGRLAWFLAAVLVSNIGNWFHVVASVVVVYDLTGSGFAVGLVSFANFVAFLAVSPRAGTMTDRLDRRRVLLVAQSASAVVAAALGAAFLAGAGSVGWILTASVLLGVGSAFSIPSVLSLVPDLVAPADHGPAIALNTAAINVARVIGPIVGAMVLAGAGPGPAFAVNASTFLLFAVVLLRLRAPGGTGRAVVRPGGDLRYRAVLALVWRTPELRRLMIAVGVVGVLLEPNTTLAAPLVEQMGGETTLVGGVVAAFGIGSLLGLSARPAAGRSAAPLGLLLAAVGLGGAALASVPVALLGGFALAGAGYLVAISDLTTRLQLAAPTTMRGRLMALWSQVLLGVRPVSSLALGWLTDLTSARLALAAVAGLALAGVGSTRRSPGGLDADVDAP